MHYEDICNPETDACRTVETAPLTNWSPDFDSYEKVWYISHYVGGEDGIISDGGWDTEAEAIAAAEVANTARQTHTHHIDL